MESSHYARTTHNSMKHTPPARETYARTAEDELLARSPRTRSIVSR